MPDQTIEQRLDEILDLLDTGEVQWGQARLDARKALLQLLNEARIDELSHVQSGYAHRPTRTGISGAWQTISERITEMEEKL